uniref:transmembrane protein 198-like isoform X1 n=1 Tax=Solea senegalensis TaxID=28829 RepID=UPI001CD866EF|nr:transmembrane protein 198-like isoform X1 [Solea senegalensis]XP_043894578.1 transmembrane protein 198-like isoform X1 [Solea senegalensis]
MAVSLITEEPGVDLCMLKINMNYEVMSYVVCSVCLSFGLIYCFLGYRCFKMVMFFSGFMFGTIAILLLYHKEPLLDVQLGIESKAGICLGVGVLCGLMTTLLSTLGLFLSGLQLGTLLTLITLVVIEQFYSLTPAWVPLTSILVVSITTAVFMLKWQKMFSIFYTSVLGATTVILGVDYLVGTFMLPNQVYDLLRQVVPDPLCWFDWVIIAICPVLSLLGVLVQWKFTAKGVSHRAATYEKQKKHANKQRYRECRRRPQSHRRRRRGPPPLKRYAGDVLAPSYIQSLQERQMGTGSSGSSVSTITHTLIDFDFETGSMVPLTAASSGFTV